MTYFYSSLVSRCLKFLFLILIQATSFHALDNFADLTYSNAISTNLTNHLNQTLLSLAVLDISPKFLNDVSRQAAGIGIIRFFCWDFSDQLSG